MYADDRLLEKIKIHTRDHNVPHVQFEFSEIVVRIDIIQFAVS